jgi:SAM-dependent methyltransferase
MSGRSPDYRQRLFDYYVSSGQATADPATALSSRRASHEKLIRHHFPPEREIQGIDLGCGFGALLHFAHRAGYRNLRGVDTSREQVELAAELGIEGVSLGDLREALVKLPDASQDLVVTTDVLEHVPKDQLVSLVDEVHRVLRPGARWIIRTPNGESPMAGRIRYGDLTHELAFTRLSLNSLLLASGFSRMDCFEASPVRKGALGTIRWVIWKVIRASLRAYLAVESGEHRPEFIFTQNLLAVAYK